MTGTTRRLPYAISEKMATKSKALTDRGGQAIDVAIDGIPFRSAASSSKPFRIQTAEMQREQRDMEREPGEQTLQGWWIRGQDSWHQGAGYRFQESRGEAAPSAQFFESKNVDVWTEGELKLLRRMEASDASDTSAQCMFHNGTNLILGVGGDIVKTTTGSSSSEILHNEAGETFADVTATREHAYGVTGTGKVVQVTLDGSSFTVWQLDTTDPRYEPPKIAWAKHRLFVTYGRAFYVMTTEESDAEDVSAKYTHPTTDWSYSDIAEGPAGVYLSGNSHAESSIQQVSVSEDSETGTLEITPGVTTAVLPPGENADRVEILGGTWAGVGTSKGLRLGQVDQGGSITYGPLFIEPDGLDEDDSDTGCVGLTAHGRFFYVSFRTTDARAVAYRVDSSTQFEDGTAAWVADVELDTSGCFTDLAVTWNDRVVASFDGGSFGDQSRSAYRYQLDKELVPEGWIRMGFIRYRTAEPKVYKWFGVDMEPLDGSLTADAVLEGGSLSRIAVYNEEGVAETSQEQIPGALGPRRALGLEFTLRQSSSDATKGPVVTGYQVKALPAVKPQRLIQLPLMCWDREVWHTGQRDGYDGFAFDRLRSIWDLEDTGDTVLFQNFAHEDTVEAYTVRIDAASFQQTAPPHPKEQDRGFGGILTLVLRTLD